MEQIFDDPISPETIANREEKFQSLFEALTEKDIAVFSEIEAIPVKEMYSDGYVAVLCLGGKGSVKVDGNNYEVRENDMFLCQPNLFIENAMVSCDFKLRGILMSKEYFQTVFYLPDKLWKVGFDIMKTPLIHLNEQETSGFILSYDMLKYKLSHTHMPHHSQSTKLFLQSMVYEMYDVLSPKLQISTDIQPNFSSGGQIFRRFLNMVTAESPYRHNVIYYADKLCITPKYLSAICKIQAKKTASEIIDEMVTNYIKQMLRSSTKSIKEIANDTGFDNLSFFGKYVRRKLGMSPREYRIKE